MFSKDQIENGYLRKNLKVWTGGSKSPEIINQREALYGSYNWDIAFNTDDRYFYSNYRDRIIFLCAAAREEKERSTFLCVPAGYLSGLLVSRVYGDTYWYLTAVELCGFGGMAAGGLLMSVWGGFKKRRKTMFPGLVIFGATAIGMGCGKAFCTVSYLYDYIWCCINDCADNNFNTSIYNHEKKTAKNVNKAGPGRKIFK